MTKMISIGTSYCPEKGVNNYTPDMHFYIVFKFHPEMIHQRRRRKFHWKVYFQAMIPRHDSPSTENSSCEINNCKEIVASWTMDIVA